VSRSTTVFAHNTQHSIEESFINLAVFGLAKLTSLPKNIIGESLAEMGFRRALTALSLGFIAAVRAYFRGSLDPHRTTETPFDSPQRQTATRIK
jgi:hypothetical protein